MSTNLKPQNLNKMINLMGAFVKARTDAGKWIHGQVVIHELMGNKVLAIKEDGVDKPHVVDVDTIAISPELSEEQLMPLSTGISDEEAWLLAYQGIAAGVYGQSTSGNGQIYTPNSQKPSACASHADIALAEFRKRFPKAEEEKPGLP